MVPPELQLASVYSTPVFTLKLANPQIKRVYGAKYSGRFQAFVFPAFYPAHKYVLSDLRKVVKDLSYSEEVKEHVRGLQSPPPIPAEYSFVTTPYAHQREGLEHLLRYPRAGLFFSPGLGKCKITVDLQRIVGARMLIICPVIMLKTWKEEFITHGNEERVVVIEGTKKAKLALLEKAKEELPPAVVISYSTARLHAEHVQSLHYNTIVFDESHQLKSPHSKRTKAMYALAGTAARRILLSGTPSLGSPFDLYAQLRILGTYFCPEDWWTFRKKFGVFPKYEAHENVPRHLMGFKNLDVMNKRVHRICITRTKEECLDLPDRQIIDVRFDVTGDAKKKYNEIITEGGDAEGVKVAKRVAGGVINHQTGPELPEYVWTDHQALPILNKLDQLSSSFVHKTKVNPNFCDQCKHVITCSVEGVKPYTTRCHVQTKAPAAPIETTASRPRLAALEDLLETILQDEKHKVIVWAKYRQELDDICTLLDKQKIGQVRVQGGMSVARTQEAMDTFNTDPACRVYVGQVSTGIGVTLNAAQYTVYYKLPWSLDHYLQSLDRNYRIGQKNKVTVYRLVGNHTLDESIISALDDKMDFSQLVTAKSMCAVCPDFYARCQKYKIELFDPECKYEREMERSTAIVRLLP